MARTVAAIEAQMSATAIRRSAAKAAILRRRDDAKRAEADVVNYQRQVAALAAELEELFDERATAQMVDQVRVLSNPARILEAQS